MFYAKGKSQQEEKGKRRKELLLLEENVFSLIGHFSSFYQKLFSFLFYFPGRVGQHTIIHILGVLAKWHGVLANWRANSRIGVPTREGVSRM